MNRTAAIALKAVAFPLVLVLVLLAVKSQDDLHDIPEVGYKLQEIEDLRPETVFIGSSHTYRHMDVVLFDSLNGAGTSYNLGLRGATALEIHYQAERMLSLPFVRRLVIELRTVEPTVELEGSDNRRYYYYHDASRVKLASDVLLASDLPAADQLRGVLERIGMGIDHYLLTGQGDELVEGAVRGAVPFSGHDQRGFLALDRDPDPEMEKRRAAFLTPEAQARFAREVERVRQLRQRPPAPTRVDTVVASMWAALYRRAEAKGVDIVFVEQAGEQGELGGLLHLLRKRIPPDHIVVLNDPIRFPTLADPVFWFDRGHLSEEGARRATQVLFESLP